jgi:hypothetical protein
MYSTKTVIKQIDEFIEANFDKENYKVEVNEYIRHVLANIDRPDIDIYRKMIWDYVNFKEHMKEEEARKYEYRAESETVGDCN